MISLLAVAAAWSAPDLMTQGTCPGRVGMDISGGTPGGKLAVLTAFQRGGAPFPGGPCPGNTGLSPDGLTLRGVVPLDANGGIRASPTLPPDLCGSWLQLVDVATCELSTPRSMAVSEDAVDLRLYGAGYQAYAGRSMWFALHDQAYEKLATRTIVVPADGRIDVRWSCVLVPGSFGALFWAVDVDGDGACDPPPTDHGWSVLIQPPLSDVQVRQDRTGNWDYSVCSFL